MNQDAYVSTKSPFLLRDTWETLKRRRWLILSFLVGFFSIGVLVVLYLPAQYSSSATFLARTEDNPLLSELGVPVDPAPFTTFNTIVYSNLILSALEDSLRSFSEPLEGERRPIKQLISTSQIHADAFRVEVRDRDPRTAFKLAGALVTLYMKTGIELRKRRLDEAVNFLEERVQEYQAGLDGEVKRNDVPLSTPNTPPPSEVITRVQIERLETERASIDEKIAAHELSSEHLDQITNRIDDPEVIIRLESFELPVATREAAELRTLATRYAGLLRKYTTRFPEVQTLRRQLLTTMEQSRDALVSSLESLRARREELLLERSNALQTIREQRPVVLRGTERMQAARDLVEVTTVQLGKAKTLRDLVQKDGTGVVVIDRPVVPTEALGPSRSFILCISSAIGLILGLLAAALAERFDPTIRAAEDLAVFEKPVIAYIQ